MDIVRWETPPVSKSGRAKDGRYAYIADALRANPGEWAVVAEQVTPTLAYHIKKGMVSGFAPAGSFEATSRRTSNKTKRVTVYARFVG